MSPDALRQLVIEQIRAAVRQLHMDADTWVIWLVQRAYWESASEAELTRLRDILVRLSDDQD